MKILFIVQGEGRGHLMQAIAMERLLERNNHKVVKVLVGKSKFRTVPSFFYKNIKAEIEHFQSPNFLPSSSNRGCNLIKSILYNLCKIPVYFKSMRFINKTINNSDVDLVINFYELMTGFAYMFYDQKVPQISIGHQYLFLHKDFKFPHKNKIELYSLLFFTKLTCYGSIAKLALSFKDMKEDLNSNVYVVPPILRNEVKKCKSSQGDYIHGYMLNSGYSTMVQEWHKSHKDVQLHFFWDKSGVQDDYEIDKNLTFHKIDDKKFLQYMSKCKAFATTAGFESVCEAIYLGKPILMVPSHIEQDCNAYDAQRIGAGIISDSFDLSQLIEFTKGYNPNLEFKKWVKSSDVRMMYYIENSVNIYRGCEITTIPTY